MKKTRALTSIKGKKGQQLNQREAKLINDMSVNGMLLFDVDVKNGGVTINYNTNGLISLYEFLKMNEISKRLFVVLMRNIVFVLKSVEENRFSKSLVMWSLRSSYIDPATWHIYLMYVPLQPYETTGNLKSFLLDIVSSCTFIHGDNVDYVQRFVKEINSGISYTAYMLEGFCDRVSDEISCMSSDKLGSMQCPSCKSKLISGENVCPFCGVRIRNDISQHHNNIYISSNDFFSDSSDVDDVEKEQLATLRKESISINENENGVVTVFGKSPNSSQNVWLEDLKCDEKIVIAKSPFRVGKMEGVTDYRIFSSKVSRKHADILKEQGKSYIVDLGSTNGTFLDGKRIQPGVKEELFDGAYLKFADVEYKFHIG